MRRDPTDHLGCVAGLPGRIAGIDPLRRKAQKEVHPCLEPGLFHGREHELTGRAGVRGGFQHHELGGPERGHHGVGGSEDEGDIRIAGLGERRGNTDRDGVTLGQPGEVSGSLEPARADLVGDVVVAQVLNVGLPGADALGHLFLHVETQHLEAAPRSLHCQR